MSVFKFLPFFKKRLKGRAVLTNEPASTPAATRPSTPAMAVQSTSLTPATAVCGTPGHQGKGYTRKGKYEIDQEAKQHPEYQHPGEPSQDAVAPDGGPLQPARAHQMHREQAEGYLQDDFQGDYNRGIQHQTRIGKPLIYLGAGLPDGHGPHQPGEKRGSCGMSQDRPPFVPGLLQHEVEADQHHQNYD